MKLILIPIFILACFIKPLLSQEFIVFDEMEKIVSDIKFIKDFGQFDSNKIDIALQNMETFIPLETNLFYAEKNHKINNEELELNTWYNEENAMHLQTISGNKSQVDESWESMSKIGTYSGWEVNPGNFYMRYDSVENNIINVLFRNDIHIFSLHSQLPFATLAIKNDRAVSKNELLAKRLELIAEVIEKLATKIVDEKDRVYRKSDEPLSAEERIYGFTQFWMETKYNFAFFDQVPHLDWDAVYHQYLPKIMKNQTNSEYYNLLERMCALLEDGHTNIFPPSQEEFDYPKLSLKNIQGKAIVQNMSVELASKIPKGTEVISVDGVIVPEYIETYVKPYISASTAYIRENESIRKMLKGITGSEVVLGLRSVEGREWQEKLTRERDTEEMEWALEWQQNYLLKFEDLGERVAYVGLGNFGNYQIVKEFEAILDTFTEFDHYIIDLRDNGGGNSWNGYNILKYFADKPFKTSKWSTREHLSSFKAWGQQYLNTNDEDLSEWQMKAKKINLGNYWYVSDPDTINNEKRINFKGELIVLIGNQTASAAEDFLIALDDLGVGKMIGQPTFGSTGQPLMVRMPRGGSARICTKKDTYPDGREFVGYGIKPDVLIEVTLDDYLSDKDRVLEEALRLAKKSR